MARSWFSEKPGDPLSMRPPWPPFDIGENLALVRQKRQMRSFSLVHPELRNLCEMEIYICRSGETSGPYDESSVRRYMAEGHFSVHDLGWCEGMSEWENLEALLAKAAAPSAPIPPAIISQPTASFSVEKNNNDSSNSETRKKGTISSFLGRFLGRRDFFNYDEVPAIFYRFGKSKEYGPARLDRVLGIFRSNKDRQMAGRFVDDKTWRAPSYFFDLWFTVPMSSRTQRRMEKAGIPREDNMSEGKAREFLNTVARRKPASNRLRARLSEYAIGHTPDILTGEARTLIAEHQKRQYEAEALRQLLPRLEAVTAEVRGKLIGGWKPKTPQNSVDLESYIRRIEEALEQALNYNADDLNSRELNTPSSAFYVVSVEFEISEQCMNRFRQLAFENYLKTGDQIDEVACARKAGIQIEK
jgi:GYF domain 2